MAWALHFTREEKTRPREYIVITQEEPTKAEKMPEEGFYLKTCTDLDIDELPYTFPVSEPLYPK